MASLWEISKSLNSLPSRTFSHVWFHGLCDPMDYIVHGILQYKILEWVVITFSRGSSQPRDRTQVSCIAGGFFTIWATREAQEYWSGIFPVDTSQESNWGLLLCKQILYQLSYQLELSGKLGLPGKPSKFITWNIDDSFDWGSCYMEIISTSKRKSYIFPLYIGLWHSSGQF